MIEKERPFHRKLPWERSIGLFLLLLCSSTLFAQPFSELRVRDGSGIPFKLKMDGEWVSDEMQERFELDSLSPGDHRFETSYPDTGISSHSKTLKLKAGTARSYIIHREKNGKTSWEMISEIRKPSLLEKRNGKEKREEEETPQEVDSSFIANYQGKSACKDPLGGSEFEGILEEVEKKTFEKDRFSTAKKRIAGQCLLSTQIMELMETLDYEENRLDLAKYAFGKTFDQGGYDQVKEALHFRSSKKELDRYLQEAR